jgi:hypothetical protein
MRTLKLLSATLTVAALLAAFSTPAEARPGRDEVRAFGNSHRLHGRRGAKKNNVPELSVGAAAAALGLLGGGLMVMTGRRKSKRV